MKLPIPTFFIDTVLTACAMEQAHEQTVFHPQPISRNGRIAAYDRADELLDLVLKIMPLRVLVQWRLARIK